MKHLCTILILTGMAVTGMRGMAQEMQETATRPVENTVSMAGIAAEATLVVARVDLNRIDLGQMYVAAMDAWQKLKAAGQLSDEQSMRFDSLLPLLPLPGPVELVTANAALRGFSVELKRQLGTTELFFVVDQDSLPSLPLVVAVRANPVIDAAYRDPKFHQWLLTPFGNSDNDYGFVARRSGEWYLLILLTDELRLPGSSMFGLSSSGDMSKKDRAPMIRRADDWFSGRVPNPNPAIDEAFALLQSADGAPGAAVQVVAVIPPYAKRIVAQIDPKFPAPLDAVHVASLMKVRWAAVAIDPERMEFFCAVQTDDAAAADEFNTALNAIRSVLKESLRPLAGTIFLSLIEPWGNLDSERFFTSPDVPAELRAQWERLSVQWEPFCSAVTDRILPQPVDGRYTLRLNPENTLAEVRPEFVEWIRISATVGPETLIAQATHRTCVNNMKQLGLAFHTYHDSHREFPPAYTVDADGEPLHSWRVLILPYIEQSALYNAIRLDEPWDSEWNQQFHDQMPDLYRCGAYLPKDVDGSDVTALKSLTPYCLVTGDKTYTLPPEKMRLYDITDGTSNTVLVTERRRPVCWMAPVDLPQEKAFEGPEADDGIGAPHPGGFNATFGDGSSHFIPASVSLENLRAILTKAGGESIGWSNYQ